MFSRLLYAFLVLTCLLAFAGCSQHTAPSTTILKEQLTAINLIDSYEIALNVVAGEVYWINLVSEAADLSLKIKSGPETIAHVNFENRFMASESIIHTAEATQQIQIIITPYEVANHAKAMLKVEQLAVQLPADHKRIQAESVIQTALEVHTDNRDWNATVAQLHKAQRNFNRIGLKDRALWAQHLIARITYTYIYDLKNAIKLARKLTSAYNSSKQHLLAAQAQTLFAMALLETQGDDTEQSASNRRKLAQSELKDVLRYLNSQQAWAQSAWAANNLGLAYFNDKNDSEAAIAYQAAITYSEQANLKALLLLARRNAALVLNNMGRTTEAISELEAVVEALEVLEKSDPLQAVTHQELANLYFKMGSWEDAISAYSVSLDKTSVVADRVRSMIQLAYAYLFTSNAPRANVYYQLASAQTQEIGEVDTRIALEKLQAAMFEADNKLPDAIAIISRLATQAPTAVDKATLYIRLSDLYIQSDNPEQAAWYADQATSTLEEFNTPYQLMSAQIASTRAQLNSSNPDTSSIAQILNNIINDSKHYPNLQMQALHSMAETSYVNGDLQTAQRWSGRAVEMLRTIKQQTNAAYWIGYFHRRRDIHKQHIRLLLYEYEQARQKQNIGIAEKLAKTLLIKIDEFKGQSQTFSKQSLNRTQLDQLNTSQAAAILNNNNDTGELDRIEAIRRTLDSNTSHSPVKPLSAENLGQIQLLLDKKDAELIVYWLDNPRSAAFTLSSKQIEVTFLESEDILRDAVRQVLQTYSAPSIGKPAKSSGFKKLTELFTTNSSASTYIIADEFLAAAPFSLYTKSPLVFLPSLKSLLHTRGSKRNPESGIAIFADPVYTGNSNLTTLQGTKKEAEVILNIFSDGNNRLFTQEQATREKLLQTPLTDYRYIHLAAHSITDLRFPSGSSIILSGESDSNSMVNTYDIRSLNLNAELVVLSACQTNFGRSLYGESSTGLADAFHQAGADAVITTLWKIPDHVTSITMDHFYTALHRGNDPQTSLYLAQSEVRETQSYRNPYYWAAWKLYKYN